MFDVENKMNKRNKKYFSKDKKLLDKPVLINDTIHVETNISPNDMIKVINKILYKYDFEFLNIEGSIKF